jgi:hypothetical protein
MATFSAAGPLLATSTLSDTDQSPIIWLVILVQVLVFGIGGATVALRSPSFPFGFGLLAVGLAFLLQTSVLFILVPSHSTIGGGELFIDEAFLVLPAGVLGVLIGGLIRRFLRRYDPNELPDNNHANR